jgi:Dolichyl-phosphate-mannose-protein mannosyltransferase
MESRLAWSIASLAAVAAAGLVVWAAQPYPGTTVDSGEYLAVADGLANGHGLSMSYVSYDEAFRILEPGERVQMTQFPPLYPATIAATHELTGTDLLTSAALLGMICSFLSVLLACLLVWETTRDVKLVALAGGLLLASQLVTLHSMVWSEAPMILGLVGAMYLTQRVVRTGRTSLITGAVLFAGMASLARYVGIAVALAVGLSLIGVVSRVRAAFVTLIALVPVLAWFVRNAIVSGAASEKTFGWHPPTGRHLVQGAQAIGSWITPGAIPAGIAGAVATAAVVVWLVKGRSRPGPAAVRICLIFGGCYVGTVLVARTFLDQNIPLDTRILAPLQVIVIVAMCSGLAQRSPARSGLLVLTAVAVIAVSGAVRGVVAASGFERLPVAGYTGEEWRASETLAYAGGLLAATQIITNTPDPIWIWHRKPSHFLPPRSSLYSGEENENYALQLQELRTATSCDEAVVVFFDRPTRKPARSIDPVIVTELELELIEDLADGAVYEVAPVMCAATRR